MLEKDKIYFLSDAHLKLDRKENTVERKNLLIRFLKTLPDDTKEVILLGDIFDFWYEWYYVIPAFYFDFFYEIRKLIDRGIKVSYISGNHDFHLGDYLKKEVGINCIDNVLTTEYSGKKFWIYHGDGIAESDKGYRFLKKILRSKICNFLFRTFIHPDLGILIANFTSKTSRKHRNQNKLRLKKGEYLLFAESKLKEGYDYVILGHRHHPELIETKNGYYVNTGDWMKHFSYAIFDGTDIKIRKYND